MLAVTVSQKFQVVIPQAVREQLHIEAGQKLQVLAYEHRIELLPVERPQALRGFLVLRPLLREVSAEKLSRGR